MSASPEIFDGDIPGQYFHYHPDGCYGVISKKGGGDGVSEVAWVDGDGKYSSVAEAQERVNKGSRPVDRLMSRVHPIWLLNVENSMLTLPLRSSYKLEMKLSLKQLGGCLSMDMRSAALG